VIDRVPIDRRPSSPDRNVPLRVAIALTCGVALLGLAACVVEAVRFLVAAKGGPR
jgi:hypothetical protein